MPVNLDRLTNATVKKAILALQNEDGLAWTTLFEPGALFYDDGSQGSLAAFTENVFGKGHEHFTSIDGVENSGLDIYGHYHSDQWGDFKTYFKFHLNKDLKIIKLEVGQANY